MSWKLNLSLPHVMLHNRIVKWNELRRRTLYLNSKVLK